MFEVLEILREIVELSSRKGKVWKALTSNARERLDQAMDAINSDFRVKAHHAAWTDKEKDQEEITDTNDPPYLQAWKRGHFEAKWNKPGALDTRVVAHFCNLLWKK